MDTMHHYALPTRGNLQMIISECGYFKARSS